MIGRRWGSLLSIEPRRFLVASFVLAGGVVSILIMGVLAVVTNEPFIFPSLGPTAYLLIAAPLAPEASLRNTIGGHLAGLLCGYLALTVFGLTAAGPVAPNSISLSRASAAALSLGLTSALMIGFRFSHPPATATTLIVSLGLLTQPGHLAILMLGVVLLLGVAGVVNLVGELTGIEEAVEQEEEERAETGEDGDAGAALPSG